MSSRLAWCLADVEDTLSPKEFFGDDEGSSGEAQYVYGDMC